MALIKINSYTFLHKAPLIAKNTKVGQVNNYMAYPISL